MTQAEFPLSTWLDRIGSAQAVASLAELLPDVGIYMVNAERNVVFWSAGAERLLGFTAAEVLGQPCLKSDRLDDCMRTTPVTDARTLSSEPITLFHKNGSPLSLRKSAKALFENGAFRGSIELIMPDHIDLAGNDDASRVRRALAEHGGHIGRAAASLGVSRPTFWRKRKKHGI